MLLCFRFGFVLVLCFLLFVCFFCFDCLFGLKNDSFLLCQQVDEICTPGYCKNSGTCIVVGTKPFCKCPPSYLPPLCLMHVNTTGKGFLDLLQLVCFILFV